MQKIYSFFKKYKSIFLYTSLLVIIFMILVILFDKNSVKSFFNAMELKSFDVRQLVISEYKDTNPDIVIVTVDDPSYEYILNHYGEWPVSRGVYSDFVDYVEAQNPLAIVFDLLFIKPFKNSPEGDKQLVNNFKKYDNLFTAINFDDQPREVREPAVLPEYLSEKIEVNSRTFNPYVFSNCRAIMSSIMHSTKNVGQINTSKSDDGVNRMAPLFVGYPRYNKDKQIDYYPYMTLKVAKKYLEVKEGLKIDKFVVNDSNDLLLGDRKLHMLTNSEVVLNWYGESGVRSNKTFVYIPFWKVLESIKAEKQGKKSFIPKNYFNGKVVYMGTSVVSLADIKMVPTEKYMPGVELHATLLNNIIDDNLIKMIPIHTNIAILVLFAIVISLIVFYVPSIIVASCSVLSLVIAYIIASTFIMYFFDIWVWVVLPVITALVAFSLGYIVKYIIKSRDFEYTYKLATTDGLTELYNHRFFQEQMIMNIEYAKRSGRSFSLILLDIDFFKKFNDTYGHQAGDAVLKQVAQTLKKNVRSSDIVCRYGGEEMTIILRDTDKAEAYVAAQKICDAVASRSFKLGPDLERNVTVSLGVATYPMDGDTPAILIAKADEGLYYAKEHGRNQVGRKEK